MLLPVITDHECGIVIVAAGPLQTVVQHDVSAFWELGNEAVHDAPPLVVTDIHAVPPAAETHENMQPLKLCLCDNLWTDLLEFSICVIIT